MDLCLQYQSFMRPYVVALNQSIGEFLVKRFQVDEQLVFVEIYPLFRNSAIKLPAQGIYPEQPDYLGGGYQSCL